MNEKLLQFIWQFQYFNKKELQTVEGESLHIIHPGSLNHNQGPDFLEAKIKISDTIWVGNVELHIKTSAWDQHRHSNDTNYANVVLHVVWLHDANIKYANDKTIATLELQPLVSKLLLKHYGELMEAKGFVPCEKHLPVLSDIGWIAWKERLVIERLERKAQLIIGFLEQSGQHWEEVFWWMLAKNFGTKVNAALFEDVARSLSVNILAKHKNQIHQLEALLMGQANLLKEKYTEDYPKLLRKEFNFLSKKYKLQPITQQPAFLRMRPANFPTIRLAQLAMMINQSSHLFSKIKDTGKVDDAKHLLDVTANDYWHYHYLFDEPADFKPKKLGGEMVNNIIINTVVPVLFSYGLYRDEQVWKDKAVLWLSQLRPEQNSITKQWKQYKVKNESALDSQGLIELKNNYCNNKRCLDCAVGNKLLRN